MVGFGVVGLLLLWCLYVFSFDCVAFDVFCGFSAVRALYDLIACGLVCGFLNCFGYCLRLRVVVFIVVIVV